jgi:hypothetical protein
LKSTSNRRVLQQERVQHDNANVPPKKTEPRFEQCGGREADEGGVGGSEKMAEGDKIYVQQAYVDGVRSLGVERRGGGTPGLILLAADVQKTAPVRET